MTSNWARILTKEFEIHSSRFLKAVLIITAPLSAIKHCFFLVYFFTANNCTVEVQIHIVSSCRGLRWLMAALCFVAVYAIAQLHTSVKQGRWSSLRVSDYVLLQSFFICRHSRPYRFSHRWMNRRDSRSSGPHLLCIALFSMLFFVCFCTL